MKFCPKCGAQLDDNAVFCSSCGANFGTGAQADVFDHTSEFDAKDVSENKVYAMVLYLMGILGIIIALLASKDSPYLKFHIRQVVKLQVVSILSAIVIALLVWTIIVPIVGGIWVVVIAVVQIICFFRVCMGKSVEPPIVRSIGFLR